MTLTAPPAPVPSPAPHRQWVRVLLWTAGAVAVSVAALVLWFAAVLSGGWDDLLSPGGPVSTDAEVVAAGERTLEELAREALPVGAVSAVAEEHVCSEGQHNWKVDDEYDLSCVATRTVLSPGEVPAFQEQAAALHERLAADGWRSEYGNIPSILTEYWGPSSTAGNSAPGDLPPAEYVRGDLRLEVRWISTAGRLPPDPPSTGGAGFRTPDGRTVDPQSLVSEQQYAVSLSVSTESFRD